MRLYTLLYLASLIGGCGYALAMGGRPERIGAAVILAGMVLSNAAGLYSGHVLMATDSLDLLIDVAEAVALIVLACAANRFWPLWAAMLQLDTVFTHVVMYAHGTPPFSYGLALRVFAFPLPLLVGIGALRYRKRSAVPAI